jgi:hypothetical protein
MLIGLRIVLVLGVLLAATAVLGYLFTRKPVMLVWAKRIGLGTIGLVALLVLMHVAERVVTKLV